MTQHKVVPTAYERIVKTPRITYYMLLISMITSLLIGGIFAVYHWRFDAAIISLLAVSVISAFLLYIHSIGRYRTAGYGLYFTISVILTYNIGLGHGIFDEAMLAFPLLIVFAGLVFGRKIVVHTTALTVFQIMLIYVLSTHDYVRPFEGNLTMKLEETITTAIIMVVTGMIVWIVVEIIERTVDTVAESEVELESAYDLTLRAWALALELRGREVPGHCERVTLLATRFGEKLGFSPEEVTQLRRGALLHDIGKMGIPEKILLKPGALTKEEWEVVTRHPQLAMEIFEDIPYLKEALSLVVTHHEMVNGQGYPNHLKGDQIPAAARAFTIVDNWDVLRSERPYSPAWSDEQTAAYIREQSGKKFDPEMVEAFFNMMGIEMEEDLA